MVKKATTYEEQCEQYKKRKLLIDDDKFVKDVLERTNYYRLSGYAYLFEIRKDNFGNKVNFKDIYEAYCLDENMRLLLFKYLHKIEIRFKCLLAYEFCHATDPLQHTRYNSSVYINEGNWKKFNDLAKKLINNNRNLPFIKHHLEKYNGEIPIWVLTEIISFGEASKFYYNLQDMYAQKICQYYCSGQIHSTVLKNWMHFASLARNYCAHGNRIYKATTNMNQIKGNNKIDVQFIKNKFPKRGSNGNELLEMYDAFNYFIVISLLLKDDERQDFVRDLKMLQEEYNNIIFENAYFFSNNWVELLSKKPGAEEAAYATE
jgi:abortive infection bacteriophage resistance protein